MIKQINITPVQMQQLSDEQKQQYVELLNQIQSCKDLNEAKRLFEDLLDNYRAEFLIPVEKKTSLSKALKDEVLSIFEEDAQDSVNSWQQKLPQSFTQAISYIHQPLYDYYEYIRSIVGEENVKKYFNDDLVPNDDLLSNFFIYEREAEGSKTGRKIPYIALVPVGLEMYVQVIHMQLINIVSNNKMLYDDIMQQQAFYDMSLLIHSALVTNPLYDITGAFNHPPASIAQYLRGKHLENAEDAARRTEAEEKINASKDITRFIVQTDIECLKCHKKTVIIQQKQLRSADEATATIYICTSCGYQKVEQ